MYYIQLVLFQCQVSTIYTTIIIKSMLRLVNWRAKRFNWRLCVKLSWRAKTNYEQWTQTFVNHHTHKIYLKRFQWRFYGYCHPCFLVFKVVDQNQIENWINSKGVHFPLMIHFAHILTVFANFPATKVYSNAKRRIEAG